MKGLCSLGAEAWYILARSPGPGIAVEGGGLQRGPETSSRGEFFPSDAGPVALGIEVRGRLQELNPQ